ncbi:hypothetical protein RCF27_06645 [Rhodococcus pyridinivorans]|uniref:hypothetical protein n=1 Tax=Rhodococcus pyridinivorans TaxID=103816 RepID=UPI001D15888A|nr:hypothetical protein [Rhodococcus pyridinivorans]WMM73979.1 hypothetical protein RCF27_06645 [Rhodococcus pyridinivorans]
MLGVGLDAAGSTALAAAANGLAQALAPESVATLAVDSAEVDGVTLLDAPDLVEALGATAGEAFVVRPDGLLLCRVPVADLDSVAASLRSGAAPAGAELPARPAEQVTEDDQRRENVWLGLSITPDQAPEDDREGFLARLALVLGSQVDRRQFEEAIAAAADTSPLRVEELAPQA